MNERLEKMIAFTRKQMEEKSKSHAALYQRIGECQRRYDERLKLKAAA